MSTRIELAPEGGDDLERILDHLALHAINDLPARAQEIIQAICVLEQNPLIGRPAAHDMRELVIGQQSRSHIALYRYIVEVDTILVLAIRCQKEAGYARI